MEVLLALAALHLPTGGDEELLDEIFPDAGALDA